MREHKPRNLPSNCAVIMCGNLIVILPGGGNTLSTQVTRKAVKRTLWSILQHDFFFIFGEQREQYFPVYFSVYFPLCNKLCAWNRFQNWKIEKNRVKEVPSHSNPHWKSHITNAYDIYFVLKVPDKTQCWCRRCWGLTINNQKKSLLYFSMLRKARFVLWCFPRDLKNRVLSPRSTSCFWFIMLYFSG